METNITTHFKRVLNQLRKFGFLLESDPKLPSVCTLITGEPLRGSWWSHPLAQTIFQVNERLEDHPDVLIAKLVSGKVTFVHRDLWSEVFVIGSAREPWQMKTLSASAHALLKLIDARGTLTTEKIALPKSKKSSTQKPGEAARELERKILVHAEQFHTTGGMHAKLLETWKHWATRTGFSAAPISVAEAKSAMENRVQTLNRKFKANARLPWMDSTS